VLRSDLVELSWLMRLRIAAAMGAGALLIGILCWPSAAPAEPFGVVAAGNLDGGGIVRLLILSLLSGFLGYFLSWPFGKQIAVLAAPTGLAVWSIRSGSMANLMQANSTVDVRMAIFEKLRWESFFWLVVVLAGFAGVYLANQIRGIRLRRDFGGQAPAQRDKGTKTVGKGGFEAEIKRLKQGIRNVNILTAVLGSALIAVIIILQLAQGERFYDERLGYLTGQPDKGQIIFGVIGGFAGAGFVAKKFLGVGYFGSILAAPVITIFVSISYANQAAVEHLTADWPAVFFANSLVCILPIQMVSFGTLGAIAGYWMAVRYNYWRRHEGR
jgi:hypothetical protein